MPAEVKTVPLDGAAAQVATLAALNLPLPLVVFGPGMAILWVSAAASAEFRLDARRLVGRSWYELFPDALSRRDQHEQLFTGALEQLHLARVPLSLGCAEPRTFSLRLRPLRGPGGAIDAVLGVGEDVTHHVAAEEELRQSEHRLAVALWSSQAAYWTIDTRRDAAELSPEFFRLTGIAPSDWGTGPDPWNGRMHPHDLPRVRRIYEDYVAERIPNYECEYRLRTPSGWLWMHDRGRVTQRDETGRIVQIAGTSQDASARKQLEQALHEVAEREQRRISHDLHDGLGQELTAVHLLLGSVIKDLRLSGNAHVECLERVAALVRGTIKSMRTISHGLAAAIVTQQGLTSALSTLAHDVSAAYGMDVSCSDAPLEHLELSSTAAQHLFRIAQEALTNARRHGSASRARIALTAEADAYRLVIEDNGAGIPASATDTDGLGLRIMGYRAQSIGGTLAVRPLAAGGTRVEVCWPRLSRRTRAVTP